MRNNELLPYDTIVQATSGEPEAVNTVLQYYGRRIRYASRISGQADKSPLRKLQASDGAQFQTGCSNILVQRRTGTCGANSMYIRSLSGQ